MMRVAEASDIPAIRSLMETIPGMWQEAAIGPWLTSGCSWRRTGGVPVGAAPQERMIRANSGG
jgi:hypothetical protein